MNDDFFNFSRLINKNKKDNNVVNNILGKNNKKYSDKKINNSKQIVNNILGKNSIKFNYDDFNRIPKRIIKSKSKKPASLKKQREWKNFSRSKRNHYRNYLKDTDGDRVPDKFDCNPTNVMKQDSQIYLDNNGKKQMFYTSPRKSTDRIHLNRYKNFNPENEEDVELISNLITHEEVHNELYDKFGYETSSKFDAVNPVVVKDDEGEVMNKEKAGRPVGYQTSKSNVKANLNRKIPEDVNHYDRFEKEKENETEVEELYDKFDKRSDGLDDEEDRFKYTSHSQEDYDKALNFIYRINDYAWIPVKDKDHASNLIISRFLGTPKENDAIWNNLSTDLESIKFFKKPKTDPTIPVLMVNIDFLQRKKGNPYSERKKKHVKKLIKSDKKFNSPIKYYIKDGEVGEGNHRVKVLKQMGYESAPVKIVGAWD